jgi:hypothetical protein
MPLRVAEKDGYIYAVNRCLECPFLCALPSNDHRKLVGRKCGNADADPKAGMEVCGAGIPVWCPLPEPHRKMYIGVDMASAKGDRTGKLEPNIRQLLKPEEMPRPVMFIVQGLEVEGMDRFVTTKPEFPQGPDWTYLRKGDCLITYTAKSIIRCWVAETPRSSRVKMTLGGEIKEGDWLTLVCSVQGGLHNV